MAVKVKICGIRDVDTARHAAAEGADFLGFIHFPASPRHLGLDVMARLMAEIREAGIGLPLVSVVVNPDDIVVNALRGRVRPDLIQLHGHETPSRTADISKRAGIGIIKVISVAGKADLPAADGYQPCARHLMFDAKTPKDAALPGGLGVSFDWTVMRGYAGAQPWFLAGGLTPGNVAEALRLSEAPMVDVSSGVESTPGLKDRALISGFLKAAKSL